MTSKHKTPIDRINGVKAGIATPNDPTGILNHIRQNLSARMPEDVRNIAALLEIGENEARVLIESNLNLALIAIQSALMQRLLALPQPEEKRIIVP